MEYFPFEEGSDMCRNGTKLMYVQSSLQRRHILMTRPLSFYADVRLHIPMTHNI